MKSLLRALIGFLILNLLILGCKKDKDDGDGSGFFKIGDNEYIIAGGELEYYGTDDWYEGYGFDLFLLTSGIKVDEEDNWTGTGAVIYFEMFTSSNTGLANGNYILDGISDPSPEFTFDYADYCLNWVEGGPNTWIELVDGQVDITRTASTYEITITGEDELANEVTGYYKGKLDLFDYSVKSAGAKRGRLK